MTTLENPTSRILTHAREGALEVNHARHRNPPKTVRRANQSWRRSAIVGLVLAIAGAAAFAATAALTAPDWSGAARWPTSLWSVSSADAQSTDDQPDYLARSTLMALNDANRTGNYSVLRDLASPAFQSVNSPAALARIFEGLRREHVDLSVAALVAPVWDAPPAFSRDGLYRIAGHYRAGRHLVRFSLAFVLIDESWRLIEIGVRAEQVQA